MLRPLLALVLAQSGLPAQPIAAMAPCRVSPTKLVAHEWVEIDLLDDTLIMKLDGQTTNIDQLLGDLSAKLDVCEPLKQPIYLLSAKAVSYKQFMKVANTLLDAGYTDLRLIQAAP